MPSSELSNALNPYISQSRSRPSTSTYSIPYDYDNVALPPPQPYVPHRSELELAISEPQPPPPPINVTNTVATRQPNPANIQAVQELLHIVAATRKSQEVERERRLAWEQEQEARFTQRQLDMERMILEMRQEITVLRSNTSDNSKSLSTSGLLTPQYSMSPAIAIQRPTQPASPISPVSQPSSYTHTPYIPGSHNHEVFPHSYDDFQISPQAEPIMAETPAPSATPSPSPQLVSAQHPPQLRHEPSVHPNQKKRRTSVLSSEDEGDNSDSSASNNGRRFKRVSHHDKRCLTIHHAIREHILRLMQIDSDKELPDSHIEGVFLGPNDPVRFVWDKTTKQSVHNTRMKTRVITDIKANRKLYKHVSDKDFGKKNLEAAFEASFITFRHKFKTQRDADLALHHKKREEAKARKARHLSRRKMKLSNRAEARLKVDVLQHVIFDGALQLECMSSEDSDDDGSGSRDLLRTRGYAWQSTRLKRFYSILDDEERADKFLMPKRGVGKRTRSIGPPKEGFHLPPKQVATWMISRQWFKSSQKQFPDLQDVLARLIVDPPGFNWDNFDLLGEDSDTSGDEFHISGQQQHSYAPRPQHAPSTSSLNYALM